VDTVVEIGPGKTLSAFFKKTAPGIKTYNIDTAADFQNVVSALKGEER
jgi:[acyl-carrier-protein] S-malonyltransferase